MAGLLAVLFGLNVTPVEGVEIQLYVGAGVPVELFVTVTTDAIHTVGESAKLVTGL